MNIKNDPLYKEFVLNRNLKPETIRSYNRKLRIYCEVTGLSLTQLIEEAEDDEDNGIRFRKRRIKMHFQDLQDHLIKKDYSSQKIVDIISTIRGFYSHFEIQIPKRAFSSNPPDLEEYKVPTKEDIKLAINNSSLRFATFIMFMATTGITLVDVMNLKFSDFLLSLNIPPKEFENSMDTEDLKNSWDENDIQTWHIRRQKSTTAHYTFTTPETTKHLFMYMEQHPPKDPDDSLFRGNTGNKMRQDVFQDYLRKLNTKCGWPIIGKQIFLHSHSFRKYFTNTLEGQGMPHNYIRELIGHRKDQLTRAYFYTPLKRLREEYFKYMPHLIYLKKLK